MGKKIFKITSKANKELRWYDDSRESQFIVYSPYFVYSFIDRQDAIESGCDVSNLEFRNISDVVNAFSRNEITSGDILKGAIKNGANYKQKEASPIKYYSHKYLHNVYIGADARNTVVVREDYLPKDYNIYNDTNVATFKDPIIVQDRVYDCRWAYILPVNSMSDMERYINFNN